MNDTVGYGAPFAYDYINAQTSQVTPSTVHVSDTGLAWFFRRYLLQKAMSVFTWKMPENWDKDYFLYTLYCWGYVAVVNTDKYGIIPQGCALQGYNIFYRPKNVVITNPLLTGMLTPDIDVNCTLFKLQPDYCGIMDLVNYYGDMMALCAQTVGVNLVNSKLSYVFGAKDSKAATSFKKLYDDIASGEPCAIYDKALVGNDGNLELSVFTQNVGQNYIADRVLADMSTLENMFNTDVGIPNANTNKKERMVVSEVESNNTETSSKCSLWLDNLQEGWKKTNAMFGTNGSVEWRVKPLTVTPEQSKPDKKGGE